MGKTTVFFRNDDVNVMEPGLVETTDLLLERGVPVSHAVEPANLAPETASWLLAQAADGVEIIQHGYAHARHDVGEFGGNRGAADQEADLRAGLAVMRDTFGDAFFPAMSFPFGAYNEHSIPLLDRLGYPVVSCHWRHQFSRRVYYGLGRMLGKGRWLGRHVSHHLRMYPGTGVREISVAISPIVRYFPGQGPTACRFMGPDSFAEVFRRCRRAVPVVGIVLHHRFHAGARELRLLGEYVDILEREDVAFGTIRGIHEGLGS